ncbi:12383_t:CDS:2, partial [Funneliformis caledonium]
MEVIIITEFACFTDASAYTGVLEYEEFKGIRNTLVIATIILGCIHLNFELRQIYYNPTKWSIDPWNYFDLGAAFELFGVYFAIVVNVAKKTSSFLVILFIVLLSFAHAFWILLKLRKEYDLDTPPTDYEDPNNPWLLTGTSISILDDGTIERSFEKPDKNTNMFSYFRILQVTIPMMLVSLIISVYLMNLLIGLLSNAIDEDNRASFLMQKAKILAEIELFYLFPNQRRWKTWFPDV